MYIIVAFPYPQDWDVTAAVGSAEDVCGGIGEKKEEEDGKE